VVTRLNDRAELFRNISPSGNHWLAFRLEGSKSNRSAIGARVRVGQQWNHVTSSVGYASSSDLAVHFGLGNDGSPKTLEIEWPSGARQRLKNVRVDGAVGVREPDGAPAFGRHTHINFLPARVSRSPSAVRLRRK